MSVILPPNSSRIDRDSSWTTWTLDQSGSIGYRLKTDAPSGLAGLIADAGRPSKGWCRSSEWPSAGYVVQLIYGHQPHGVGAQLLGFVNIGRDSLLEIVGTSGPTSGSILMMIVASVAAPR